MTLLGRYLQNTLRETICIYRVYPVFLFDGAVGLKEVTLSKDGDEISLFLVCGCLINEKLQKLKVLRLIQRKVTLSF